ncbi:hypothetical protein IV454_25465 [Massilia antarctica]|uniref:Uncharacterized protein n=1 Tax=Massilia antarctica TaxID=2765360 RepID=A0AA48WA58_9BURK|nr:hypothetical protein [Massilia antarctica]QPI48821.1 hypothetical protein IV454_25465 [Massilia antarctica]
MKFICAFAAFVFAGPLCCPGIFAQDGTPAAPVYDNITLKNNRILILSAAYLDANADTVGFNKLNENVTQAFSQRLQPKLVAEGKLPLNVNDPATKFTRGEKLALHASGLDAEAAVILSLAEETDKDGLFSIFLRVQFFDLKYMLKNGKREGVVPISGFERTYFLTGPKGDSKLGVEDLASSFFLDLKHSGRLTR